MPLARSSLTPCATFHDRLAALAAERIERRAAAALAAHAAQCPDCAGALGHERRFSAMMQRHCEHEEQSAPPELRNKVARMLDQFR